MISQSVGGSSSTGAKFCERTCLGSTEGLMGGSMKLLIMLSIALKIAAGSEGSGGDFLADVGGFVETADFGGGGGGWVFGGKGDVMVVVVLVVGIWGFSSILTEETLRIEGDGGVKVDLGVEMVGERKSFGVEKVERKEEEKASMFLS